MKIIQYPNPILNQICLPVENINNNIRTLVNSMMSVMKENNGYGLSASQIGKPIRLFIYDIGEGVQIAINPIIKSQEGIQEDYEGCLSIHGYTEIVKRYESLTMIAYNMIGTKYEINVKGLESRVIQHEIDYLDGILFIDRIEIESI